ISVSAFGQDEESYFDFWVGSWDATWDEPNGKIGKGTNTISKILDDSVILENFVITEGQSTGFKGTSISVYQKQLKTWKQSWADSQTNFFYFKGSKDGDKRIFQTDVFDLPDGKKSTQRMVFDNIETDSFIWNWESSIDGGQTWTLNWQIRYNRKQS
ncbi:MAG: hypothetical protein AAF901_08445, partial [Bacteroidota bacterium]